MLWRQPKQGNGEGDGGGGSWEVSLMRRPVSSDVKKEGGLATWIAGGTHSWAEEE